MNPFSVLPWDLIQVLSSHFSLSIMGRLISTCCYNRDLFLGDEIWKIQFIKFFRQSPPVKESYKNLSINEVFKINYKIENNWKNENYSIRFIDDPTFTCLRIYNNDVIISSHSNGLIKISKSRVKGDLEYIKEFKVHDNFIWSFTIAQNYLVSACNDGTAKIFEITPEIDIIEKCSLKSVPNVHSYWCVDLNFKNDLIALGNANSEVVLFQLSTGNYIKTIKVKFGGIIHLLMTDDYIFVSNIVGYFYYYDFATGKLELLEKRNDAIHTIKIVNDDLITVGYDRNINITNYSLFKETKQLNPKTIKLGGPGIDVVAYRGRWVSCSYEENNVVLMLWNESNLEFLYKIQVDSGDDDVIIVRVFDILILDDRIYVVSNQWLATISYNKTKKQRSQSDVKY